MMEKPIIYNLRNQGEGIYSVEKSDYKHVQYGDIFIGADDWMIDTGIYNWTQTGFLEGEDLPVPNGSLIRVDDPDIVVYMLSAWPTIVGGSDASRKRFKNLHFFTDL